MQHRPNEEPGREADTAAIRRLLARRRTRCLRNAIALLSGGAGGAILLSLWGLRPAAFAIPVFFSTTCLMVAAAAAAMFARIAQLQLNDLDEDSDDDGRGPGGGSDEGPDPMGGGGMAFDWPAFEREFRAYADQAGALHV